MKAGIIKMKNMNTNKSKLKELECIIEEYQDQLFRFAFFRTGSLADSQDIVQDLFVKLFGSKTLDISSVKNIKSYLFRSISNSCCNYFRKQQEIVKVPVDNLEFAEENENEQEEWHKEYERINDLIGTIPYEQAEIIRMRMIDGLAFTEIADILEVPVTTVKSRFKYGIDKLKTKINSKGDVYHEM